jgi:ABA sandwich protein
MPEHPEPGRELDVRVAEILGWEHHWIASAPWQMVPPRERRASADVHRLRELAGSRDGAPIPHVESVPFFSTNISSAWQVVEHLRGAGYGVKVDAASGAQVVCWIQGPPHGPHGRRLMEAVSADTAPHAICLAALAIHESSRPEGQSSEAPPARSTASRSPIRDASPLQP